MKRSELKKIVQEVLEDVLTGDQVCESTTRIKFYAKLWPLGHNTTYAASGRNAVTIRGYETKKDRDNDVRNYTAPNHTPTATLEPTTANDPDVRRASKNGDILTWDVDYNEWMVSEVKEHGHEVLTEASEIGYDEAPADKQKAIDKIEKVFESKTLAIFEGIHGYIVYLERKERTRGTRYGADTLKQVIKIPGLRWVDFDSLNGKGTFSVGF